MSLATKPMSSWPPGPKWSGAAEFAVEVIVGTIIFVLLAIPPVVINLLVKYLASLGIDGWIALGLKAAEYSLFLADLILFLNFVIRVVLKQCRRRR